MTEDIVKEHINDLYKDVVDTMTKPIIRNAVIPVFKRWRSGEINKLTDTNEALEAEIAAYLRTDEARELMVEPIAKWLKPIAEKLEEYTEPICIKHHVPYTALSLKSYMKISDIEKKYGKCSSRIAVLEGQKAKLDEQKKQLEEQIGVLKNEMVQLEKLKKKMEEVEKEFERMYSETPGSLE